MGCHPDWLVSYAYLPDLTDVGRITEALKAVLINPEDKRLYTEEDLLSKWMGVELKLVGVEDD